MMKRGKILRDTNAGPGLLFIDGQQFPFTLEKNWKSGAAPTVGMVVDVEITDANEIASIAPIDETQLAKEQAEKALSYMKGTASKTASGVISVVGVQVLVAIAVLALGWFYFDLFSLRITKGYVGHYSFWTVLSIANSVDGAIGPSDLRANGHAGIFGLAAIIALLAPALPSFWKDSRAHLGGLLPLALMVIVTGLLSYKIYDGIQQAHAAAEMFGGERGRQMMDDMASSAMSDMLDAFSLGIGLYVSLAASLYLAGKSAIKFLASRA